MMPIDPDTERLIIVCGVGRSGTSLLQSMLNAHPDICFPPESHFLRQYLVTGKQRRRLEREGPKVFSRVLENDLYFSRLGIAKDELLWPYVHGKNPFELAGVFRRMLGIVAKRKSKKRVGEKDPRLIDYLPSLKQLFPRAFIIHLVRDPRDVLLSRMKAEWSAVRPWFLHVFLYRSQLAKGRSCGRRLFGKSYTEFRYEDLIVDPVRILGAVCGHVDVEFDEAMLNYGESARTLVSKDEMQWKKKTLGPLISGNKEKWRTGLSPWQIRLTEAICSEAFDKLGYQRAGSEVRVSVIARVVLWFAPLTGRLFDAAYTLRNYAP